jgi:tetratricopeptide (TPR) repeat protein
VYADQAVKWFNGHYSEFGDWKSSRSTYEEALLQVRDGPPEQYEQIAQGLLDLAHLKRFMGRHADASALFEALCELDERGYFAWRGGEPSSYRAALAEYFADIGDVDRARRCIERGHELRGQWRAWRKTQFGKGRK